MNRKSELRLTLRRPFVALLGGCLALAATGCVSYRAHVTVDPVGKLEVEERAELLPGVADSVHLDPKLAWTAFEATTQARGGTFAKDRPDSLKGATARYEMDEWAELGARGQAFKGFDEIERRTRPICSCRLLLGSITYCLDTTPDAAAQAEAMAILERSGSQRVHARPRPLPPGRGDRPAGGRGRRGR